MSAEATPPRKRDADRTRAQIFRAATREFGQNGYAGARIERIVARSGCNIRMIYHHFGSKAGLYRAVVEEAYANLRGQEAALDFDLSNPLGCLEQLQRFTMQYFAKHPDFEGIIRSENDLRGRVVSTSDTISQSREALNTRLAEIVRAGESCGQFRPDIDPLDLYVTITALARFHLANGYSLSAVLGTDLRDTAWRAHWSDHAVDLIRRYVTSGSDEGPPEVSAFSAAAR